MNQKVVVITGTNSGFGYLMAKDAAAKGHKVYATMRQTKTRNAAKAKELEQIKGIHVLEADVTSDLEVQKAIGQVINAESSLDVLVNNAGYFANGISETFTTKDVDRIFDVNLKGIWRATKAALPQMRKQGEGLIINISSVIGRFSIPFTSVYNSTKFAVEGLSGGLHFELRPLGVDVALVQPGAFPTEIFEKTNQGSNQEIAAQYGPLASITEDIEKGIMQMFETVKPNPQDVSDAVLKLIDTPKGQRPLRTVVDPATGTFAQAANAAIKEQEDNFFKAFGMGDLL